MPPLWGRVGPGPVPAALIREGGRHSSSDDQRPLRAALQMRVWVPPVLRYDGMGQPATETAETLSPQYLRDVLAELLIMRGLNPLAGPRYIRFKPVKDAPPDPLLQTAALLHCPPWRWHPEALVKWLFAVLYTILSLDAARSWFTTLLPHSRIQMVLGLILLALALLLSWFMSFLLYKYEKHQLLRFESDALYRLWLQKLADGADSVAQLREHTPEPWRSLLLVGKKERLKDSLRLITLHLGWFAREPSTYVPVDWALWGLVAMINLCFIANVVVHAPEFRSLPWLFPFFVLLIAPMMGFRRDQMLRLRLADYLIENLADQLAQDQIAEA